MAKSENLDKKSVKMSWWEDIPTARIVSAIVVLIFAVGYDFRETWSINMEQSFYIARSG